MYVYIYIHNKLTHVAHINVYNAPRYVVYIYILYTYVQYNIGGGEGVKGHRRAHTHNNIIYNILLEFDLRQRRCEYKKTMQSVTGHVYTQPVTNT